MAVFRLHIDSHVAGVGRRVDLLLLLSFKPPHRHLPCPTAELARNCPEELVKPLSESCVNLGAPGHI